MVETAGLKINLLTAEALGGMPEVEESSDTFAGNAMLKAEALAALAPKDAWVLADDSGLEVDALNGAPGVHSARFSGLDGNSLANNLKLMGELRLVPMKRRTARFHCVLCFLQAGGDVRLFHGICEGHILKKPLGHNGFGYDPLFRPLEHRRTLAQLSPEEKNALSHRARAVAAWMDYLRTAVGPGT